MAIKAPAGSSLTIPDPHRGADRERRAVPHFKAAVSSQSGALALWLVAGPEEAAQHEAAAPMMQVRARYLCCHAHALAAFQQTHTSQQSGPAFVSATHSERHTATPQTPRVNAINTPRTSLQIPLYLLAAAEFVAERWLPMWLCIAIL